MNSEFLRSLKYMYIYIYRAAERTIFAFYFAVAREGEDGSY